MEPGSEIFITSSIKQPICSRKPKLNKRRDSQGSIRKVQIVGEAVRKKATIQGKNVEDDDAFYHIIQTVN